MSLCMILAVKAAFIYKNTSFKVGKRRMIKVNANAKNIDFMPNGFY